MYTKWMVDTHHFCLICICIKMDLTSMDGKKKQYDLCCICTWMAVSKVNRVLASLGHLITDCNPDRMIIKPKICPMDVDIAVYYM